MKKQVVRLTEQDLHRIIKESVKRMVNERILGQDEKFTPYTPEEIERNHNAWKTPSNPSYEEWKRNNPNPFKKSKPKGSMEEEINEIGDTQKGQYAMGKLAARQQYKDKNSKGSFRTSWIAGDRQEEADRKKSANKAFNNRGFRNGFSDGQKEFMK